MRLRISIIIQKLELVLDRGLHFPFHISFFFVNCVQESVIAFPYCYPLLKHNCFGTCLSPKHILLFRYYFQKWKTCFLSTNLMCFGFLQVMVRSGDQNFESLMRSMGETYWNEGKHTETSSAVGLGSMFLSLIASHTCIKIFSRLLGR